MGGAAHLAAAAHGSPLAAFKAFSSVASQLGSGGQANYAAANAVLDAWAHAQQSQVRLGGGAWSCVQSSILTLVTQWLLWQKIIPAHSMSNSNSIFVSKL